MMGDSLPPATAGLDLVGSFARRRGNNVEIVLNALKMDDSVDAAAIELRNDSVCATGTVRTAPAADGGHCLVGSVARPLLDDGIWQVFALSQDGDAWPVDVRLLVQGPRPLVLLWGHDGPGVGSPLKRPEVLHSRLLRSTARVADAVLSRTPESVVTRTESVARAVSRRRPS